jgi:hypothetical protein
LLCHFVIGTTEPYNLVDILWDNIYYLKLRLLI